MTKLKFIDLFAGLGGIRLGFEQACQEREIETECVLTSEIKPYAIQTLKHNHHHENFVGDIFQVNNEDIPNFDFLFGGFPCQSFSTVNPNKDTNDDRANLYKELVKILKAKQPKFFVCENVKGLVTLQKGEILKKVITEFESVGYKVKYKVLLASNFGIPQKRERVFIIGVRNDVNVDYKFPIDTHSETNLFSTKKWVPLKKVIPLLAIDEEKYYFSQRAVEGMKNAKNNMKRGLYQDLDGQCLTVTSHLAKTSLNSRDPVLLVNPEKEIYRRFTPREAASIQSFPESFLFPVSETQAYKQIGNAIPPVLMWHVANALAESCKKVFKI